MITRPAHFTLDPYNHLAHGLVFAGLGAHAGGDQYYDSSVHGNHGTLTNMEPSTDWGYGNGRRTVSVDGSEHVLLGTPTTQPTIFPTGASTLCIWMLGESNDANAWNAFSALGGAGARDWGIGPDNGGTIYYAVCVDKDGLTQTSTSGHSSTDWVHYAMVYRPSSSVTLYRNGSQVSQITSSVPASQAHDAGNPMRIGADARATYFIGSLADPMIYARAVSQSQIQALADPSNVMLSGLILPPTRKWWPVVSGVAPANAMPMAVQHYKMAGGL